MNEAAKNERNPRRRRTGLLAALALTTAGLATLAPAQPAHAATATCTTNGWFESLGGAARVWVPKDATGNPAASWARATSR